MVHYTMNIKEAKAILATIDLRIELEFDSATKTLTLHNIESSKRFGMGYAWHATVKLEGNKAVEKSFECHTADTTTGVFHHNLPAPEPLQKKFDAILEKLHIIP